MSHLEIAAINIDKRYLCRLCRCAQFKTHSISMIKLARCFPLIVSFTLLFLYKYFQKRSTDTLIKSCFFFFLNPCIIIKFLRTIITEMELK